MPANQKVMVENLESNNEGKRLGELNTQKFHTRQEKQKHWVNYFEQMDGKKKAMFMKVNIAER